MQCDAWEGHSAGCVLRIRLIQPPLRELQGLLHGAGGLEPTHSIYMHPACTRQHTHLAAVGGSLIELACASIRWLRWISVSLC